MTVVLLFQFLKNRHLMVRVGGSWDTLENYLIHHRPVEVFEHKRLVVGEPRDIGNKYLYFKSKYRSHAQVANEHNGHAHTHWEWAETCPSAYENGQGLVNQDIYNGHGLAHLRNEWYLTHGFIATVYMHVAWACPNCCHPDTCKNVSSIQLMIVPSRYNEQTLCTEYIMGWISLCSHVLYSALNCFGSVKYC